MIQFHSVFLSRRQTEPHSSESLNFADMNPQLPDPNYATETEFRWPWWKFRLPPEHLFTSLHDRFNTKPSAIQDPWAFHRDVVECANDAATVDEFYKHLATRKDQRINEMNDAWDEISCLLGGTSAIWSCPCLGGHEQDDNSANNCSASRWSAFLRLCQSMSFDHLVMFFNEYASDERKRQNTEQEESRRRLKSLWPPRKHASRNEPADNAKLLELASGAEADPEPSAEPRNTKAHPIKLDTAKPHPAPNDTQTNLPSPLSASSSPVQTFQKTRKRRRSTSEASDMAGESHVSSKMDTPLGICSVTSSSSLLQGERGITGETDQRMCNNVQISSDPSCTGKVGRHPSNQGASFSVSPESSPDETAPTRNMVDQDADPGRQRLSTAVLKSPPTHSDPSLLPPASPFSALHEESFPTSPSASTPPSLPSAKRESRSNEVGASDYGSPQHTGKKRRLLQG
ncbi:hypothetical protein CDEST_02038 [Colletotrichum destructivum]|uniref:Uncharacterized protein n=1 Tax=Colletotrichum destructivum TaxID=34406 RepID=A0AAX4I1D5_9PEZI|nr:hypothetical protein CDEST_02038 [Colletotrichum destructivum]